jgi:hypothetical protein
MAVSQYLLLFANENVFYHARIVDRVDPESCVSLATRDDGKRDDIRVIPLDAVLALPYRRAEVTVRMVEASDA